MADTTDAQVTGTNRGFALWGLAYGQRLVVHAACVTYSVVRQRQTGRLKVYFGVEDDERRCLGYLSSQLDCIVPGEPFAYKLTATAGSGMVQKIVSAVHIAEADAADLEIWSIADGFLSGVTQCPYC